MLIRIIENQVVNFPSSDMKKILTDNKEMKEYISQWVHQFGDALYSRALYKTSQPVIAEDLVQEVFLAASQSFNSYRGESTPKTWLFSILNNKIVDYYRKQLRNPIIMESSIASGEGDNILETLFDKEGTWKKEYRPNPWPQQDELMDDPELSKAIKYCMDKLPIPWMSAIQLKYYKEKDGKEISQELGITTSNYWQILHRAKLQLRNCLEKWLNK